MEDKELNEILQEVRKVFNGVFFIQTTRYDHRTWFDRLTGNYLKTGKAYTLYLSVNNFDAQVINFAQNHKWSINTAVDKSYIITYFFGLLSGYEFKNKQP